MLSVERGPGAVTVLVIGAGIIGTTYGWALSGAGYRVVHLVRPGKAARYGNGIPMDVFDRRRGRKRYFRGRYRLAVTEVISRPDRYSLVIVPTKHYQLKEALTRLVLWLWVLFGGNYPSWGRQLVGGTMAWTVRVFAYTYGLTDKYPPFTLELAP